MGLTRTRTASDRKGIGSDETEGNPRRLATIAAGDSSATSVPDAKGRDLKGPGLSETSTADLDTVTAVTHDPASP